MCICQKLKRKGPGSKTGLDHRNPSIKLGQLGISVGIPFAYDRWAFTICIAQQRLTILNLGFICLG